MLRCRNRARHDYLSHRVNTILLEPASNVLTVPSSVLIERSAMGGEAVYVVRDNKAHRTTVRVGYDNGLQVEILDGLKDDDEVVISYGGTIEDGVEVEAQPATIEEAKRERHES